MLERQAGFAKVKGGDALPLVWSGRASRVSLVPVWGGGVFPQPFN